MRETIKKLKPAKNQYKITNIKLTLVGNDPRKILSDQNA